MQLPNSFDFFNDIDRMTKLLSQFAQSKIAQAYLFIGSKHSFLNDFVRQLIGNILCGSELKSCGKCKSCRMYADAAHPDISYITLEENSNSIKIDEIRNLQIDVFQTPQCGKYRMIVINPAERLNMQAANALLKILEEPPEHTVFVLVADCLNNLPLTIISRCRRYFFNDHVEIDSYIELAKDYPNSEERASLFAAKDNIIARLNDVVVDELSFASVANEWTDYKIENIIWFLYLITAEAIKYLLLPDNKYDANFIKFANSQNIAKLYNQIDLLNAYIGKSQKNIVLNQTLALEKILLGY